MAENPTVHSCPPVSSDDSKLNYELTQKLENIFKKNTK